MLLDTESAEIVRQHVSYVYGVKISASLLLQYKHPCHAARNGITLRHRNPSPRHHSESNPPSDQTRATQWRDWTKELESLRVENKEIDTPAEHRHAGCEERLRPDILWGGLVCYKEGDGMQKLWRSISYEPERQGCGEGRHDGIMGWAVWHATPLVHLLDSVLQYSSWRCGLGLRCAILSHAPRTHQGRLLMRRICNRWSTRRRSCWDRATMRLRDADALTRLDVWAHTNERLDWLEHWDCGRERNDLGGSPASDSNIKDPAFPSSHQYLSPIKHTFLHRRSTMHIHLSIKHTFLHRRSTMHIHLSIKHTFLHRRTTMHLHPAIKHTFLHRCSKVHIHHP
jgi:hypothetical protein